MSTRCPQCPNKNACIPPDGPSNADCVLIGEAPGTIENTKGKPFQGKTGQELNQHYLPLAGLSRPKVYVTNAIRCLPISAGGKLDPKNRRDIELLHSCANHFLYPDLERIKPKFLIPMGSFAVRAIDPDINLEYQHGIPLKTKWCDRTYGMYHPALGMHTPKSMLLLRNDWIRLGRYIKGKLTIPVDEFEGLEDYRELETEDEVHEILSGNWHKVMACDTENRKDHSPFCLTFSITPGTGYLIQAHRRDLLDAFQEHLDLWTGKILWHNWLHDYEIVTAMELRFNRKLIFDTMLAVFHLGNLPQGLKALAYRELGINMQEFDDVVKPYSSQIAINYFRRAYSIDWPKPDEGLEKQKDGSYKIKKPHGFNQKLKRFFTDYEKDPDKDPFNMWETNWENEHGMVQTVMGEFPGKCISHVPLDRIIRYACQDSDGLLRFYPILKRMQQRVRKTSQDRWGLEAA